MVLELLQKHSSVVFFCRKKSFLDLIDRCNSECIEFWSSTTLRQLMDYEYIKENFFDNFDGMIDECLILLEVIPGLNKSCFIKTRFTTYTLEGWDKFYLLDYIEFIRDRKIDEVLE